MDLRSTPRGWYLQHEIDLGTCAWVSEQERWMELGLNLAVVDDLLEMEAGGEQAAAAELAAVGSELR